MYSSETIFIRLPEVQVSQIGDEMILLDPIQGEFLTFNPIASRVFELLENRIDFGKLCAVLLDEFDVDPDLCRKEISDYIADLVSRKLVRVI